MVRAAHQDMPFTIATPCPDGHGPAGQPCEQGKRGAGVCVPRCYAAARRAFAAGRRSAPFELVEVGA